MTIIERLDLELNHKDYFTESEYTVYLLENELTSTVEYVKSTMQRGLLLTVIDILDAVCNDVDLMRTVADGTTGLTVSDAYSLMQSRIQDLKAKVSSIPLPGDNEDYSNIQLLFSSRR